MTEPRHKKRRKTGRERALANTELRQRAFLEKIIQSLTHPFYVIDADDYGIVLANAAAGFDGVPGRKTCYGLVHKQDKPCGGAEHVCPLAIVQETKKPATIEHTHYDKNGNARIVEVHGYPLFDAEGRVSQMVEYSIDITERKHAEEERERLILDRLDALSKVKTLSGLLPICASCKKIRDDAGYWNQIESYIRDHSEAEFSHGICPECMEKIYPEYTKKE